MFQRAALGPGRKEKRLPVFVFPEELEFVAEDETAHKQVLTVYNPYEFNVRFQVLSNAPQKYAVVEAQGAIKAHCCVDIVVRHRQAAEGPYGVTDKFRIDISIDRKVVGRKQVTASLVRRKSPAEAVDASSETGEQTARRPTTLPYVQLPSPPQRHALPGGPSVFMVVMALVCLLVLLLPLEGESPGLPAYAHVSVSQKLIAAFALGLVTMAILKS